MRKNNQTSIINGSSHVTQNVGSVSDESQIS